MISTVIGVYLRTLRFTCNWCQKWLNLLKSMRAQRSNMTCFYCEKLSFYEQFLNSVGTSAPSAPYSAAHGWYCNPSSYSSTKNLKENQWQQWNPCLLFAINFMHKEFIVITDNTFGCNTCLALAQTYIKSLTSKDYS